MRTEQTLWAIAIRQTEGPASLIFGPSVESYIPLIFKTRRAAAAWCRIKNANFKAYPPGDVRRRWCVWPVRSLVTVEPMS